MTIFGHRSCVELVPCFRLLDLWPYSVIGHVWNLCHASGCWIYEHSRSSVMFGTCAMLPVAGSMNIFGHRSCLKLVPCFRLLNLWPYSVIGHVWNLCHASGCWIYDHIRSCLELVPCFQLLDLWPYLVMFGIRNTPCYVTPSQILMLFNEEAWQPRGTFLVVTCCRNRWPNT